MTLKSKKDKVNINNKYEKLSQKFTDMLLMHVTKHKFHYTRL